MQPSEPGRGPIAEMLDRIPGDARDPSVRKLHYAAKVEALVSAVEGKAVAFETAEKRPVEVRRVLRHELNGVPVLYVEVEAEGLPADANPFIFVNPPVNARDEREDAEQAFREMVTDAVEGALRRAKGGR